MLAACGGRTEVGGLVIRRGASCPVRTCTSAGTAAGLARWRRDSRVFTARVSMSRMDGLGLFRSL